MNLIIIATSINLDIFTCIIPLAVIALPLTWLLIDETLTRSDLDNTQQLMLELIARQQHNRSCIATLGLAIGFFLLAGLAVVLMLLFAHRVP